MCTRYLYRTTNAKVLVKFVGVRTESASIIMAARRCGEVGQITFFCEVAPKYYLFITIHNLLTSHFLYNIVFNATS